MEYVYLTDNSKLPVIIVFDLTVEYKEKLLGVLCRHNRAIAWKIYDIIVISLSFCTHKILMEENYKSVLQLSQSLNPNMKEMVKAEVIKLLDVRIIYQISDSAVQLRLSLRK